MLLAVPSEKVTLEDWMRRYQAGNGEAFEILVREISPRLRAIFRDQSPAADLEELI